MLNRLAAAGKTIGADLIRNHNVDRPQSIVEAKYQQEIIAPILYKLGLTKEAAKVDQHAFEYLQPELHEMITNKLCELFKVDNLEHIDNDIIKPFMQTQDDITRVYSRVKSTNSIWKKIHNIALLKSMTLLQFSELVNDFIAIRWNMRIKPGENRLDALLNGLKYAPRQSIISFRNQHVTQQSGFSCEPVMKLYYVINNIPIELQILGGLLEEYMCAKGYADYKSGFNFSSLNLSPQQSAARLGLCIYYAEHGMLEKYRELMLDELISDGNLDYTQEHLFTLDEKPNISENQTLRFLNSNQPIYSQASHEFKDSTLVFELYKTQAANLLFDKRHQLFLNFVAHTDQVKNGIICLKGIAGKVASTCATPTVEYMDVGCGYGDKTLAVMEKIEETHTVKVTALDPAQAMISLFRTKAEEKNVQYECIGWNEYQPRQDYHLITSIHAFYYINDWEQAILKMKSYLRENGVICIALRCRDEVCEFRNYFFKLMYGEETREHDNHELCELLDKMGLKYEVEYVDSVLDIRDSLALNKKGIELIEFVLRKSYSEMSDDLKNEINEYLKRFNHSGFMKQRDGYILIKNTSSRM